MKRTFLGLSFVDVMICLFGHNKRRDVLCSGVCVTEFCCTKEKRGGMSSLSTVSYRPKRRAPECTGFSSITGRPENTPPRPLLGKSDTCLLSRNTDILTLGTKGGGREVRVREVRSLERRKEKTNISAYTKVTWVKVLGPIEGIKFQVNGIN